MEICGAVDVLDNYLEAISIFPITIVHQFCMKCAVIIEAIVDKIEMLPDISYV